MKQLFLIAILTISVSCGKKSNDSHPQPANETLFHEFVSVDGNGLHGINNLDYRSVFLNTQLDTGLETLCDGTYGNSGQVNGADPSRTLITGDAYNGVIQVGHTKYVGATNPLCREISKEAYTYSMNKNILTLCMVNYDFCADYKVVD